MPSLPPRPTRLSVTELPFYVFLVTLGLCLFRAADLPSLDIGIGGTTLSIGPADPALLVTGVLAVRELWLRRRVPSPWLLGAIAAFAVLIVLSAIPNSAGAVTAAGKLSDFAGLLFFPLFLQALWEVDVLATLDLSRNLGQRMKERTGRGGVILNIGWDQAEHGMAGDSGEMFAAIKGAVMAFSRSLAQSLAQQVRVNCLAPGWIRTAWGESASDYWQARATRQALAGRWGTPEDVARAAAFLASPAADFITGRVLNVNGGFRYE